ncbi:hypothetical protein Tco_0366479 [Tanacetum coccineum]
MMTGTEFDIEKFDGMNDFGLWQVRMKALLEYDNVIRKKAYSTLILCLGDRVLRKITKETTAAGIWKKLETLYMTKSLANHLYLKKKLYTFTCIRALLLLTSLPSYYDNFVETLLYGRDTMKLEDVVAILNSRELQKMTEARGDGGEVCEEEIWSEGYGAGYNHKKSQGCVRIEDHVSGSGGDGECRVRGTGKVQVYMKDGSSFVVDNVRTRRANCVYTLDGQAVTRKTLKGRKQLGEYQTGWKIKTGNVLDFFLVCLRYVRVFGWLASIKQGMLEPVKVKCIFLRYRKGIVGNKLWRSDDVTSKVLQGVEFEVEPQEDHTFVVEPYGNADHLVGSQEVQTQNLIYYHSARNKEQHSAWELFSYKEDSNEAAFAVAAVDKIYAHELLTFNNTIACEVIFKWEVGLKDDMNARSDVYVLSNGCRKNSDNNRDYYWFYNRKLIQTWLEGHSILLLEGSLSGDYDVEKNGQWSCIYAVGSQEYQMVCTRLDIASADVGMLDKFDRGLQTYVQHMEALLTTEVGYVTFTEARKKEIWLKGLLTES